MSISHHFKQVENTCFLFQTRVKAPRLPGQKAGTQFTYFGGIECWGGLGYGLLQTITHPGKALHGVCTRKFEQAYLTWKFHLIHNIKLVINISLRVYDTT